MKELKKCGTCQYVDKSKGSGFWQCISIAALADKLENLPANFPWVFTNTQCKHWVIGLHQKSVIT